MERMTSKYTKAARGQDCTVRLPGICNFNTETTVAAHLNGGGTGAKHLDIHIAFACSDCHRWLDGGYVEQHVSRKERDRIHGIAVFETQAKLIDMMILIL